jgi:superfamily II DNA or RNA helicase
MTALHLRPYQKDAVRAVREDWRQHPDVIGVLPTGGGKTVVFLDLATESIADGGRALVLAHREELIQQPIDRICRFWPDWQLRVGAIQAERDEPDRDLTVASVPTLVKPERLRRLLEHGPIDYLIVDECHHSIANSYLTIWQALREANPNLKHVGVTATPLRTDRRGLVQVYKHVSFQYSIRDLQRDGYLVPVEFRTVETGISLAGVAASEDGDFEGKALARAWECENLFDLVVESNRRWSPDRQSIAFTASVDGAHQLAAKLSKAGVKAAAADATTPKKKREAILKLFRAGEIDVLCNCFMYTEGLDVPEVSAIHWLRPTKSKLVVTQGVGRALRPALGKTNALVLFYSPVEIDSLATPGDILGEERQSGNGEEQEERDAQGHLIPPSKWLRGDKNQMLARPIELLPASPLSWGFRDNLATLGLGRVRDVNRTLAILPKKREGQYVLVAILSTKGVQPETTELGRSDVFEEITEMGADYAEKFGEPGIFARERGWRSAPVTDAQIKLLVSLHYHGDPRRLSKGDASETITHLLALKALRRNGWTWSAEKKQAA